jgi:hypothetical protein
MLKSWKLLVVFVAVFSAALYLWAGSQQQTASTQTELQPSVQKDNRGALSSDKVTRPATSTLSTSQNAVQVGKETTLTAVELRRTPIVDAYEKSTNWAAFIESAKHNPAEGGYYMASVAASNCAAFAKKTLAQIDPATLTAPAESVARRTASLKSLQERCRGYEASSDNSSFALLKEGARQRDPLVKLQNDLRDARMGGELGAEQIRQALALNNPYAIEAAMTAFQAADEKRLRYNGNAVGEDDSRSLRLAFQLLPCAFGRDCGSASAIAAQDCIGLGNSCDMDRFQQIQGWGVAPREWERVMQYYHELEHAYRNGNYSIVVFRAVDGAVAKK